MTSRGRSKNFALGFESDAILARLGWGICEMYLSCDSGDVDEGRARGTCDTGLDVEEEFAVQSRRRSIKTVTNFSLLMNATDVAKLSHVLKLH